MKLRVLGSIDGKEVSFAPSVSPGDIPPLVRNDHLIPWCCSIHLYPDECRLEIPSRGIDAKLLVTTSNHILVILADFAGMESLIMMCGPRNEEETVKRQEMTEGIEETITDPEEVPARRTRRVVPRKPRVSRKKPPPAHIQLSPALQSELRKLQHAAARGSSASAAEWVRVSRAADKALALLLPEKGPRSMEISTVYTCQDTEYECETETEQCGVDETQQCDHAAETEQKFSEDFHRQRCELRARRDAKLCCKILIALGRRDWKTWNDVPLEFRKDIERIHRNLGHASADQLEKLFRDANVSDDAISALKRFRCDACDRLKQPPSKRKVAVNHAETFNDTVHGCEFLEDHFQGISLCEDDTESAEHRGCFIRYAHCDSDR